MVYSQQKQRKERDHAVILKKGKKKNTFWSLFRKVMFRVSAAKKSKILISRQRLLSFFLSAKLINFATESTPKLYTYPVIYSRVIEPPKGEELCLSVSRARTELFFFVSSAYSSQICILYKIIERERNRGGGKEDTGAKKNKT